ncbi:N-6 DNA methylase [Nocardia niwae]|uniref:N-6 DNA methylase n=1 Tax=Nocardia niwae TaxID=626084 RepID=A0ABV2XCZ8_9NOCA|nr:N-6 DNA methylase [Nocardia niwae]
MSETTPLVTAAEISRLAGVTRATVSNWRRRHPDFPGTAGGSESRPLFDWNEVRQWLREHGVDAAKSPVQRLRTFLRTQLEPAVVPELLDRLVCSPRDNRFLELSEETAREALRAVRPGPDDEKAARVIGAELPEMLRAAEAEVGIPATLEILAERGLDGTPTTGVYPTEQPVAALMADLAAIASPPETVLDPACGSGTLLAEAVRVGARTVRGQEVLAVQAKRTAALLRSRGVGLEIDIRTGDSLLADAFPSLAADAVLVNPPYQQRDWGADELALDSRWQYSVPSRGESELAWVQHALAHLRPGGVAVLLLPPAVAARGSGRKIRSELVRAGAVRAMVGLPAGVSAPRQVGLHLWVLRRPESGGPIADRLLFIDTTATMNAGSGWDSLARTVLDSWRAFDQGDSAPAAVPDVAAAVRTMDVLDDEVDLTPARHVRAALDPAGVSGAANDAIRVLADELTMLTTAAATVSAWSSSAEKSWRTVTVGDLMRGGALRTIVAARGPADMESDVSDESRPVLTGRDLVTGAPPSGRTASGSSDDQPVIAAGDVLVSRFRSDHRTTQGARVADGADVGAVAGTGVVVFRPDPTRLDPWFLAGFIGSAENSATMAGTTTIRLEPARLRIPMMKLADQQRYGQAFRRLDQLRSAARRAAAAAQHTADLIGTGLTVGALAPQHTNTTDDAETKDSEGRK